MARHGPKPVSHGQGWSEVDDRMIYAGYIMAEPFKDMGLKCGRSASAVRERLKRLGLMDQAGQRVIEPPSFEETQARCRVGPVRKQQMANEEHST